jgi:4-phospho-D-threonate 3-dehydrogenase / 4-phospho-D-erythronate 3-dehydrogenase
MNTRIIAVTMGDPAGVGPELCVRLLAESAVDGDSVPMIVGDARILSAVAEKIQIPLRVPVISQSEWDAGSCPVGPSVLDLANVDMIRFQPGVVSAAAGRAAFEAVAIAIDLAMAKTVAAIVTAPINKESLSVAGIAYPGHTEILAERTATPDAVMMLASEVIACGLVTTHIGLKDVPARLSTAAIVNVIEKMHAALLQLRGRAPKLVVCGLNPHAGEHGLFGAGEEERIIRPAIDEACRRGIHAVGPLPPDTAFIKSIRDVTDGYVAMYHDQGLIPLKALSFDDAVNVTLGLPIVRTSVDHGTAFDIAWQGIASPSSLFAAYRVARQLMA